MFVTVVATDLTIAVGYETAVGDYEASHPLSTWMHLLLRLCWETRDRPGGEGRLEHDKSDVHMSSGDNDYIFQLFAGVWGRRRGDGPTYSAFLSDTIHVKEYLAPTFHVYDCHEVPIV